MEQPPLITVLHEHALPMRSEQAEIAVHGRQEAIDAGVPLGHHRVKYAAHPRSGGQSSLIGCNVAAGAQQMAVRPQNPQLLAAQYHVAVGAMKKREQLAALVNFLMAPL